MTLHKTVGTATTVQELMDDPALKEIVYPDWRLRAQCRTMDPTLFETPDGSLADQELAQGLCAGCPVVAECAITAIDPLCRGTVRGGVGLDFPMRPTSRNDHLRLRLRIAAARDLISRGAK